MATEYDFKEHTHRFAAWAAGRAAATSTSRFTVATAKSWIESVDGLRECVCNPDILPKSQKEFDDLHRRWRDEMVDVAGRVISHGVAAKLINVYLKAAVVHPHCANDTSVGFVHPPIDRLLLSDLRKKLKGIWSGQDLTWSKFDSEAYEDVIAKVRQTLGGDAPLWKIEYYWAGNQ